MLRSIGVSNYRISDLEKTLAVARHRPTVNQIELHPYVLKANAPLLAYSTPFQLFMCTELTLMVQWKRKADRKSVV